MYIYWRAEMWNLCLVRFISLYPWINTLLQTWGHKSCIQGQFRHSIISVLDIIYQNYWHQFTLHTSVKSFNTQLGSVRGTRFAIDIASHPKCRCEAKELLMTIKHPLYMWKCIPWRITNNFSFFISNSMIVVSK